METASHICVDCTRNLDEGEGEDEVTFTCDPYSCEIEGECVQQWRCGRCVQESSWEI